MASADAAILGQQYLLEETSCAGKAHTVTQGGFSSSGTSAATDAQHGSEAADSTVAEQLRNYAESLVRARAKHALRRLTHSQANDLDEEGSELWTGATGICKSHDFRTLARSGEATDCLWHAILLEGRGTTSEAHLLPSYMYEHIHKNHWTQLDDVPTGMDCLLAVPKAHGRMALKINWEKRSILYYIASGRELTKQNRRVLNVSCIARSLDTWLISVAGYCSVDQVQV